MSPTQTDRGEQKGVTRGADAFLGRNHEIMSRYGRFLRENSRFSCKNWAEPIL